MSSQVKKLIITNKPYVTCETFIKLQIDSVENKRHYYLYRGFLLEGNGTPHPVLWNIFRFMSLLKIPKSFYNRLLIRFINPDVVLSEYGNVGAEVFHYLPKKVAHVIHFHGHDAVRKTIINLYANAYKRMFQKAHAIISVSKVMTEKLVLLGADRSKVILNPCGPHSSYGQLNPKHESNQLTFVGRFVEKKSPHLLIYAFHKVLQECPRAELVMIGEGPLFDACVSLVSALGIGNNVIFKNRLNREGIQKEFEQSLAYVQHSITAPDGDMEGTPVSILEACLAGLPVVSTHHAGIPEVIENGETGFLVEELDLNTMAEKMVFLLQHKEEAKRLGRASKIRVNQLYSVEQHLNTLNRILEPVKS